MVFLLLAIVCTSSIALIFKHSETSNMNRYALTATNYATAVLVCAAILLLKGLNTGPLDVSGAFAEIRSAISSGETLSRSGSFVWATTAGLCAGLVFFLALVYYQISVRHHGAGLAGSFIKLGTFVPMILSLLFWRENPSTLQWLGIALALGSILLVNWPGRDGGWRRALKPALLLLFLFGGAAEFSNKVFQKYGLQDHKAVFLGCTFFVAFLFALGVTLVRRKPVQRRDVLTGIAVGIPNLFSSFFLIIALDTIPAAVAFPAFGAGSIVIIALVGTAFFGERLKARELAAIALTILALVVINL
ncbi:EamA family transporter [bacterium]|nr:EamA family transporter [bacterium]